LIGFGNPKSSKKRSLRHERPEGSLGLSGWAKFFLSEKVILEFSVGPSGQENISVRMEAVRKLLIAVQMLNLQNFFLAFQRCQFCPNPIFD
jgi:hypothetical protein